MKPNRICIGSRASQLAILQSRIVMEQIHSILPEVELELIPMKTTGDRILQKSLAEIGGKGLFLKELELALETHQVDLCVHSLKDVPVAEHSKLPIGAYLRRAAPNDVLVLPEQQSFSDWNRRLPVGSSSSRRAFQLQSLYPACSVRSVRGNLQTRLKKLEKGNYGALILAEAGLQRSGLSERIAYRFPVSEMVPAAGQGILAVQSRKGEYSELLRFLNDSETELCARMERMLSIKLGGDCTAPVGAYAELHQDALRLYGFYSENGVSAKIVRSGSPLNATGLAEQVAGDLLEQIQQKKNEEE